MKIQLHSRNLQHDAARAKLARLSIPLGLLTTSFGLLSSPARAQMRFSIDYRGPTISVPAPVPITEGDVLTPVGGSPSYGPLPPPFIAISGGFGPPAPGLGLPMHPGCIGHPPGFPCGVELDALSFGVDYPVPMGALLAGTYVFSVDSFAIGFPGSPMKPNVLSESPPVADGSADVFEALALPGGPLPPGPAVGNTGIIDGNGLVSASGAIYQGSGLIEPNPPFIGPGPSPGDNLDAVDLDSPSAYYPVYFSLDAAFFDPLRLVPNTGSGPANGEFPGGIYVVAMPGGPPALYAPPLALGLDLMGPGSDDLDALALWENGTPGFQPGPAYKWTTATPSDMALFSVRRGSAVIGMPDSLFGIPIEAGDILCPPAAAGLTPQIFIAAEWLGLATTRTLGVMFGDDLDALDTRVKPQTGLEFCFGDGTGLACPCANFGAPGHGCANSVNPLGGRVVATGTASVSADSVVLNGSDMTIGTTALYFQGTAQAIVVLGDGIRCAGGAGSIRLGSKTNDGTGASFFPDIGLGDLPISVGGLVPAAGATRFYQIWYRNPNPAFCPPNTFNLTNGLGIVWTP